MKGEITMRKLNHTTTHTTTFDAKNVVCAHERVTASPSETFSKIRHYG